MPTVGGKQIENVTEELIASRTTKRLVASKALETSLSTSLACGATGYDYGIHELDSVPALYDTSSSIPHDQWLRKGPSGYEETEEEYVNLFWIDVTEVNGVIYLFGKIPLCIPSKPARFVSACVVVHGSERNLFILPARVEGKFTADGLPLRQSFDVVYNDIKNMLVPHIIPKSSGETFMCKPVERKYAFDKARVPRQATEYLKVKYSSQFPALTPKQLPSSMEEVFGSSLSPVELFLMKRHIMGPCWLRIQKPKLSPSSGRKSWCHLELRADSIKSIEKVKEHTPSPPMVALALTMKTAVNPSTHQHEVVVISAVLHSAVDSDADKTEPSNKIKKFTMVRQLGRSCGNDYRQQWPHGAVETIQRVCSGTVVTLPNERALLSTFLARVHQHDPDIIISHNLIGFEFEVLLNRCASHKLPAFSKLGRLVKSVFPRSVNENGFCAGRLLCDTYIATKEVLREADYSLSALFKSQLGEERLVINPIDVPRYFATTQNILELCSHTQRDAILLFNLTMKLQVIPLTKQLTTCSGNIWSRTLRGRRAERIEFLLMHEFHSQKFILPEKVKPNSKDKEFEGNVDVDADQVRVGGFSRKKEKAAYAGGLVLEPKKGLYDTYILLLDFNSLYPSIIQEYNLCFTTIEWAPSADDTNSKTGFLADEETRTSLALPLEPGSTSELGILPRVIKKLVDKRAQVKNIIKKERDPQKLKQYDIRQKALKLTANSMYGCLGFSFSRFCAKPIAALVTSKV
jgi:DNA polymerase alpha subunit A